MPSEKPMLGGLSQTGGTPPRMGTSSAIPGAVPGMFNAAIVLIGPHDDGAWSQAHWEGLAHVGRSLSDVNVAYVDRVPAGTRAERIFR